MKVLYKVVNSSPTVAAGKAEIGGEVVDFTRPAHVLELSPVEATDHSGTIKIVLTGKQLQIADQYKKGAEVALTLERVKVK